MAVTRTVLTPSGLIQPQHGGIGYEADMDQNMAILNALLRLIGEFALDAGLNGVYSGLALATSGSLTPGLSAGLLYAQGSRIVLDAPVSPGPAPASATNYLFYNSALGFYYQASAVGTPGDAMIGKVTTSGSAVTAVVTATKVFGLVDFTSADDGNFTVQHYLGRAPVGVNLILTADGPVWFQSTRWDDTNLYLRAATAALTGKAQVW
jgi:hypothetical protein